MMFWRHYEFMKPKRITVYLEPDLHKALKVRAAETDQSVSELVSGAVRRSLLEDAEDLAAFKQRAREPNLAFETVLKISTVTSQGERGR
jgi:plasmid stability protein